MHYDVLMLYPEGIVSYKLFVKDQGKLTVISNDFLYKIYHKPRSKAAGNY